MVVNSVTYSEKTFMPLNEAKLRFFYRLWRPSTPSEVLAGVHGLGEHSGLYAGLGEVLASRGFAFYIMDLRGHGRSDGDRYYVPRFDAYIQDLYRFVSLVNGKEGCKPFVIGVGLGGLIALVYAATKGSTIKGVIAVEPLVEPLPGESVSEGVLKLLSLVTPKKKIRLSGSDVNLRSIGYSSSEMENGLFTARLLYETAKARNWLSRNCSKIKVPTLIVCDKSGFDGRYYRELKRLYERIGSPEKALITMPDVYEEVFRIKSEAFVEKVIGWIKRVSPSPEQG